jgi:hypothetical protein
MTWGQPLGLDELMIVNPSTPNDLNTLLAGEENNPYQFQSSAGIQGLGELFLGDDGTLYQLQRYSPPERFPFSGSISRQRSRCSCRRSYK